MPDAIRSGVNVEQFPDLCQADEFDENTAQIEQEKLWFIHSLAFNCVRSSIRLRVVIQSSR